MFLAFIAQGSLFKEYFVPGLFQFVAVGGSFLFAAIAVFARFQSARLAASSAANTANGYYPCSRYETAQALLGRLVNQGGMLTFQDAANVLDAVHIERGSAQIAPAPTGRVVSPRRTCALTF